MKNHEFSLPTSVLSFDIDEVQYEALEKFRASHKHPKKDTGAIGGKYTYSFTQTGIGYTTSVKCNICGQEEDLTNYDMW